VHESLDADGDTYISITCGGDDCDDLNPDVHPGLLEIPCNEIDDDCDPLTVETCCTPGPCTTSCGTSGTYECNPDGTPGDCLPPVETCNGVDDNCNSVCDDGYTCCARSTTPCSALGFTTGTATCAGDCSGWDTSTCGRCGDGTVQSPEECDGTALGGSTCWTIPGSYTGGTLGCTPSCTFDASLCTRCGNMITEPPEQCDGLLPPGATCLTIPGGFNGGSLRCGVGCAYDTSLCTWCGDGTRNSTEQCDGVDLAGQTCLLRGFIGGGTLGCSAGCAFDTSSCIWSPTGTWVVTPGVNYYCAFGEVSISFGELTFNDTGTGLSVSDDSINCTMTGPSARTTRTINVTCSLLGDCDETYSLVGTFTDDNTWTGTFTATFTPHGGLGCAGCSTRTWTARTGGRL
jgi:hypothetical protein